MAGLVSSIMFKVVFINSVRITGLHPSPGPWETASNGSSVSSSIVTRSTSIIQTFSGSIPCKTMKNCTHFSYIA